MSVGRYRQKTEEEMAWDDARDTLVRLVDLEIRKKRRRLLNVLLPAAFDKHAKAIARGELQELETVFTELAQKVVEDVMPERMIDEILGGADAGPVEDR